METSGSTFHFSGSFESQNNQYMGNTFQTAGGAINFNSSCIEINFFNPTTTHYELQKNTNPLRVANTCVWVLEHPLFRKWCQSCGNDILWVTADPGCGKSVLSRTIIDERLVGTTEASICYFFFKDNEEQNNVATALCAVLHQLFCTHEALLHKHAAKSIQKYGKSLTKNYEELWRILVYVAQDESVPEMICILDALDECKERDRDFLIGKVVGLHNTFEYSSTRRSSLRFLLTSRPYSGIEQLFRRHMTDLPVIRLAGEDESVQISKEIGNVIDVRVATIAKTRNLSDETREAILQRLLSIPHRTYLWLHLTIDELQNMLGCTQKKLLRVIQTLPETVEKAYEKILARCANDKHARTLLQIIVAARRPLTVREIDVALEVANNADAFDDLDTEGETHRKEWIRSACGLFVSIVENRVFLIHETAREFLVQQDPSQYRSGFSAWKYSIHLHPSELLMAKICTSYLLFCARQSAAEPSVRKADEAFDMTSVRNAFIQYSLQNWAYHARNADDKDHQVVNEAIELCRKASTYHWLTDHNYTYNYNLLREEKHELPSDQSSLLQAMAFGLPRIVHILLRDTKAEVTPDVVLAAAKSARGAEAIKMLIEERSEEVKLTAPVLIAAAGHWNGHAVIKMLLEERGEEFKITEPVLIAAAEELNGHEVIKMLLKERGDEVKITEPVLIAIVQNNRGHKVMKVLLEERGKEVNITEPVLIAMAQNDKGHDVMRVLLEERGHEVKTIERIVLTAVKNWTRSIGVDTLLDHANNEIIVTWDMLMATPKHSTQFLSLLWRYLKQSSLYCHDGFVPSFSLPRRTLYWPVNKEALPVAKDMLENMGLKDFQWLTNTLARFSADGWNYIHLKQRKDDQSARNH